jgi:peptidoglycan/LPS O-acetylase OafA/YrhL
MGIALWLACSVAAFVFARIIPFLRLTQWWPKFVAATLAALAAGFAATALDFGGWNELDWRGGVFAFLCSFAVVALVRLIAARSQRSAVPPPPESERRPARARR